MLFVNYRLSGMMRRKSVQNYYKFLNYTSKGMFFFEENCIFMQKCGYQSPAEGRQPRSAAAPEKAQSASGRSHQQMFTL